MIGLVRNGLPSSGIFETSRIRLLYMATRRESLSLAEILFTLQPPAGPRRELINSDARQKTGLFYDWAGMSMLFIIQLDGINAYAGGDK